VHIGLIDTISVYIHLTVPKIDDVATYCGRAFEKLWILAGWIIDGNDVSRIRFCAKPV
jgi:hypothetical protein